MPGKPTIKIAVASCLLAAGVAFGAEPPPTPTPAATSLPPSFEESLSAAAQRIVVENLPRQFEGQKDWGHTSKVVDGLRLREDGDRLKLRKHTTQVNNGLWKRYKVDIIDPEHQLKLRVANFQQTGPEQAKLQVVSSAHIHGEAKFEQWREGVKMLNSRCEADGTLETRIDCEMSWHWTPGKLLGDITVEPKVTGVEIKLTDFELQKVGEIEGWTARRLGDAFSGPIERRLREEEPKLVDKLNKAIAKNQSKLHFSLDKSLDASFAKLQSLLGVTADKSSVESAPAGGSTSRAK